MSSYIRPDGILDFERKYNNPLTGKPQGYFPNDHLEWWKKSPGRLNVYKERAKIFKGLHNNQVMLFTAGTGAGKTVIMPLLVLHYFNYEKIICTQPRKNLVDNQTEYSSFLLGVPVKIEDSKRNVLVPDTGLRYVGKKYGGGLELGWSTEDTKLLWATDAMIKVIITGGDEYLEDYNAILIDESHERSMHIDVLMGLCLKICKKRPEFKVVIMSATIDTEFFMNYFDRMGFSRNSIHIHVEGVGVKLPPGIKAVTDVFYDDIHPNADDIAPNSRIKTIIKELDNLLRDDNEMELIFGPDNYENYDIPRGAPKRFYKYGRDILVFAPTISNIDDIINAINANINEYKYKPKCVAYHGSISHTIEAQIAISGGALNNVDLMGTDTGKYDLKIIVATNSAEAGVTFGDPLAFVFESGLQNNAFFRPDKYLYETGIFDIAQDNIGQRRGRTGRINPGICRYMYTKKQYDSFKKYKDTDITQNDITSDILALMTTNSYNTVDKSIQFLKDMIEPVERYKEIIQVAYRNLLDNDFINKENGSINEFGKVCAKFGLYGFHIGKIIIMGYHLGILKEAIYMGAIIYGLDKFDEYLVKETDKKKIEERKIKMLENFINPLGDHLSMFNLFVEWLKVPEFQRELWEKTYNIEYIKLNMINNAVLDIARIFLQIKDDIMKLNLFYNADKYKFMIGGMNQDLDFLYNPNLLLNPHDIEINKTIIGGTNSNMLSTIFNKDIPIEDIINKAYKKKSPRKKEIEEKHKSPRKKEIEEKHKSPRKKEIEEKHKSPKNKEIEENIKEELYSDRFTFRYMFKDDKPLKLRGISKMNKIDRLYLATCFGFISTNVAIFNNQNKKSGNLYFVKYSNLQADIKNSVLHKYLKKTPKYVFYNKYNKVYSNKSLSLVSELLPEVISIINNFKYNI
jgi:hypothetical protein